MIQINQIKLPVPHSEEELAGRIRKILKLKNSDHFTYEVLRKSIDARKKPSLFYVYTVAVSIRKEDALLKRVGSSTILKYEPILYRLPEHGTQELQHRPVIIGAGPAGLFAAVVLTMAGFHPLVLERGSKVENRRKDVDRFWKTGILDTESNVQFGEGGAGTFSDGKLNTSVKDPTGKNRFVLETFVKFGAKPDILTDAKPHIGTDVLSDVIISMRSWLLENGCEFRFHACVTDFSFENGKLTGVCCGKEFIPTSTAVLAVGHSSRDTFEKLFSRNLVMEAKNFAVGFRVEHPQQMINDIMYGKQEKLRLPASPYKVTANFPNGRGVYSFCMCPGGYVVNSSSAMEQTVVNGMSYSGRSGTNANSAIIVSVGPKDFGADDPLAGVRYQKKLEHEVWLRGQGAIPQQLYGDYRQGCESSGYGEFSSQTKGNTVFASLNGLLNQEMEESFIQGMEHFSRMVPGFNRPDAILSGMESRTSSPLRILRNEEFQSSIEGLYPCGEGAGYAGGITSAAIDGMKVAEAIIKKYQPV